MALIPCPECGKEISDKVKACPYCGYPFEDSTSIKDDAQKVEITGVNIKPNDPLKTKKILFGVGALLIIFAIIITGYIVITNNKEKEGFNAYIENLNLARLTMIDAASDSESLLNLTAKVWYNSIYEERDEETDKFTRPDGFFYDDFNLALTALFMDSQTLATTSSIEENQVKVMEIMKGLQNPPKGLETCYQTVTELYSAYQGLTDLAINPTGSLQSFGESKNSKIDRFLELFKKLESQIPEKK